MAKPAAAPVVKRIRAPAPVARPIPAAEPTTPERAPLTPAIVLAPVALLVPGRTRPLAAVTLEVPVAEPVPVQATPGVFWPSPVATPMPLAAATVVARQAARAAGVPVPVLEATTARR